MILNTVVQIYTDTAFFVVLLTLYVIAITLVAMMFLWFNKWMTMSWMKKLQQLIADFKAEYVWVPDEPQDEVKKDE